MKITVFAQIIANQGQSDTLFKILKQLVTDTHTEAGCIEYKLHHSLDDENIFWIYEIWQSQAALMSIWRARTFKHSSLKPQTSSIELTFTKATPANQQKSAKHVGAFHHLSLIKSTSLPFFGVNRQFAAYAVNLLGSYPGIRARSYTQIHHLDCQSHGKILC